MECDTAREALSARIDGEREPIPSARVDEHLAACEACREWQKAAVEQTQLLRRLAGRSQVAAVRRSEAAQRARRPLLPGLPSISWRRWALGAVGVVQIGLAIAQGMGMNAGIPHPGSTGHIVNESTAWSAAAGLAMVVAAARPVMAGGLMWVTLAFTLLVVGYEVADIRAGHATLARPLSHLPVALGAVLALLVWRRDRRSAGPDPGHTAATGSVDGDVCADVVLPDSASRGRRRSHLRSTDGSAA